MCFGFSLWWHGSSVVLALPRAGACNNGFTYNSILTHSPFLCPAFGYIIHTAREATSSKARHTWLPPFEHRAQARHIFSSSVCWLILLYFSCHTYCNLCVDCMESTESHSQCKPRFGNPIHFGNPIAKKTPFDQKRHNQSTMRRRLLACAAARLPHRHFGCIRCITSEKWSCGGCSHQPSLRKPNCVTSTSDWRCSNCTLYYHDSRMLPNHHAPQKYKNKILLAE